MRGRLALAMSSAALLVACRPTHLVYVYDLSAGMDVAYSNEGNARLVFGYDRGTYALVPQKDAQQHRQVPTVDGTKPDDVMSLSSVSHVRAEGLNQFTFAHFVATGKTAEDVARDPTGLRQLRAAIYGEEEKP